MTTAGLVAALVASHVAAAGVAFAVGWRFGARRRPPRRTVVDLHGRHRRKDQP